MSFIATGSDLYIGAGANVAAAGAWTSIGCVISVKPAGLTKSFREKRPCLNAASRKVRKVPGAITEGPISCVIEFDATKYGTVKALLEGDATKAVGVVLGDSTKAQVATCWVSALDIPELTDEGDVQMSVSFEVDSSLDDLDLIDADDVTGGS